MMWLSRFLLGFVCSFTVFYADAGDFVDYPRNQVQAVPNTAGVQVLHFWATWCQPCRQEMPVISNWYAKVGKRQKVFLVGIALDRPEEMARFLKDVPVRYPIWRYVGTDSRQMMKSYGNAIGGLPYMLVRVPKCEVVEKIVGEVSEQRLNQAIQRVQAACKR